MSGNDRAVRRQMCRRGVHMRGALSGEDDWHQGMEKISEEEEQRADDDLCRQTRNVSPLFQETVET